MASVGEILTELADVEIMVNNPRRSHDLKAGMVDALAAKVRSIPVVNSAAGVQMDVAFDKSTLDEPYLSKLRLALDDRLKLGLKCLATKAGLKPQRLEHITNYLTLSDWERLELPGAQAHQIMQVIAQRLQTLGLRSLHEQTVRAAVQLTVWFVRKSSGAFPKYKLIFSWVMEFKQLYESMKAPYDHGYVQIYPMDPMQLPESVFSHAFGGDGNEPVSKSLSGFATLVDHIPLRSNSSLLAKEVAVESRAGTHNQMHGAVTWDDLRVAMQHCVGGVRPGSVPVTFMQGQQPGPFGDQPPRGPDMGALLDLQPQLRRCPSASPSSSPSASPVRAPVGYAAQHTQMHCSSASPSHTPIGACADPNNLAFGFKPPEKGRAALVTPDRAGPTAEECEEAAYAALKNRKRLKTLAKKPAAACDGKSPDDPAAGSDDDGTCINDEHAGDDDDDDDDDDNDGSDVALRVAMKVSLKRPAVAPTMKKPAARFVPLTANGRTIKVDVITMTAATKRQTTRNLFVNKWYRKAKVAAGQHGIKDTYAFAKMYYKKAGEIWDNI